MKHQIGRVHPRCHSLTASAEASAEGALRALPVEAQRQAGNRLWIKSLAHGDVSAKLMPPAAPNDESLPIFCLVTQLSGFSLLLQGSRHLPDPSTGHWRRPTTWAQCICIADEPNPEVKTTARERLASLAMPC